MSPRPKVEHLRRPQIVAAAAEVLYERGLFDTRIGDIAERAGTSSPTILYYFESKDRLLEEAVEYADRTFYERLAEGQDQFENAGDRLVHLIEETSLGPGGLNDYTLWM
jgi:AcrR family transcriptional regulator